MKYIWIILVCTFMFPSCTKHEVPIDTSFQVGNILLSNGSVIHPSMYNSEEDNAIGVVFWCNDGTVSNNDKGYAVAIRDIGEDLLIDTNENIGNVSESETEFDGFSNTASLIIFAQKDSIDCQAAKMAMNYDPGMKGWFIGSVAQQKEISKNKHKVYESFNLIKGSEPFSGWYWTSTENGSGKETPQIAAYTISLENGSIASSSKKDKYKIRPIITIK